MLRTTCTGIWLPHDRSKWDVEGTGVNSHLIYFSNSLSLSESIMFVGGGCVISSGLYKSFDLMFPFSFMTSTCSFDHESIVKLFLR